MKDASSKLKCTVLLLLVDECEVEVETVFDPWNGVYGVKGWREGPEV